MSAMFSRPWIITIISGVLVLTGSALAIRSMFFVWAHSGTVPSRCNDLGYARAQWNRLMTSPPVRQSTFPDGWAPDNTLLVQSCVQNEAKMYIDTDYGEIKDLAKAFLTLITATFVASITFSEKIVNFQNASRASAIAMFTCWVLSLLAIFSCGVGLAMNLSSLYELKYNWTDPTDLQHVGLILFFASGVSFALSLTAMFIAALPNLAGAHESDADTDPC
jgi:hypothetical protein